MFVLLSSNGLVRRALQRFWLKIITLLVDQSVTMLYVDHTRSIWLGTQFTWPTSMIYLYKVCSVYCTRCAVCIVQSVQCALYKVCSVYCTRCAVCIVHTTDQQNLALTKRTLISNLIQYNLINF